MGGSRRYHASAWPVVVVAVLLLGLLAAGHTGSHHHPAAPAPSPSGTGSPPPDTAGAPTGDVPVPAAAGAPRPPSGVHPPAGATSAARDRMRSLLGDCRAVGWDDCVTLGEHYLSATGTPQAISMSRLLKDVPALRNGLRDRLRSFASAELAGGDHPFDTGWRTYSATSGDWYYALHTFQARLVGDLWVGPGSGGSRPVQLRYRTFVYDVYDFPASGAFSEFRQLHDQGFAAEFLVTGASRTVVVPTTAGSLDPGSLALRW